MLLLSVSRIRVEVVCVSRVAFLAESKMAIAPQRG
jgi:hypothetical protein